MISEMKKRELSSQAINAIIMELIQPRPDSMPNREAITQTVHPSIPAVAPKDSSEAEWLSSSHPAIIIAEASTAGKAAKIPANDFQGMIINTR